MTRAKVSLLIPVWNAERYIPRLAQVLLRQGYPWLRVIAANDGSTDGSAAALEQMGARLRAAGIEFVQVESRENQGQAAAINAALGQMDGEYLTWMDADDALSDRSIAEKMQYMLENPDCSFLRSDGVEYFPEAAAQGARLSVEGDRRAQNIFEKLFLSATYCHAGCYMMTTKLFLRCYPSGQIPLSPVGQNLQMLLPPASRAVCAYLDRRHLTYSIHPLSHSHRRRGYIESRARLEAFRDLRRELLPHCGVDQALWLKRSEALFARELLQLNAAIGERFRRDRKECTPCASDK